MLFYSNFLFGILLSFSLFILLTTAMHNNNKGKTAIESPTTSDKETESGVGKASLKDDAKKIGRNILDVSKKVGRFMRDALITNHPFIDDKSVDLHSVTLLIQWEDKDTKEVISSNCVARIEYKRYFRFDWEQCNWVKYDEQKLTLQVKYKYMRSLKMENGTSMKDEYIMKSLYTYELWNTHLYPAKIVQKWLKGEGKFRLDHNKFPTQMFFLLEKPKEQFTLPNAILPSEGWCYAWPSVAIRELQKEGSGLELDEMIVIG